MIKARMEPNGRIYTRGQGEPEQLIEEGKHLMAMIQMHLRGKSETEEEYAMNLSSFAGAMMEVWRSAIAELETLGAETADEELRIGIAMAAERMRKYPTMTEAELRAEKMEMTEKIMQKVMEQMAEEDGRDMSKVNEMEEALRRRMQGKE